MVETAQTRGTAVLLMPMEVPPNYSARYTAAFRDSFAQVAQDTGPMLAPFPLQAFATDPSWMQADGIHPTAAAQRKILDAVLPSVLAALPQP